MISMADRIGETGRTPGLWLAPFLVDGDSETAKRGVADEIATSLARFWLRPLIDIDPDVVYFRSRNCLLTPGQRTRLMDLAHVCGFWAASDLPERLDSDERAALESFLTSRPEVQQVGRYWFLLEGREVDFSDVVDGRPW